MTMNETKCSKCGDSLCVAPRRVALNLGCVREAKPGARETDGLYSSYSAAVAANPGRKVRKVSGGLGTGSPARFAAVA